MATFTYFVYYLLHIFVYFGISLIFVCIVSLKYCVPNCVDHHWCEFIIGCFILWWIGQMACINWFNHILLAQVCFHRVFQILGAVFTKLSLYLQKAISSMEVHFTPPLENSKNLQPVDIYVFYKYHLTHGKEWLQDCCICFLIY